MVCVLYEMYSSVPVVHLNQLEFIVLRGTVMPRELKTDSVHVWPHVTEIWTTPQSRDIFGTWAVSLLPTGTELERDTCSMCDSAGPQIFKDENLVRDKMCENQVGNKAACSVQAEQL